MLLLAAFAYAGRADRQALRLQNEEWLRLLSNWNGVREHGLWKNAESLSVHVNFRGPGNRRLEFHVPLDYR